METSKPPDPYQKPGPYEILGVTQGARASARDIGRAFSEQTRRARSIRDTGEKARRMQALKDAKEQLLKPEDRILIDFFDLGEDLFADLCTSASDKLAKEPLEVEEVLGQTAPCRYDDLLYPMTEPTCPRGPAAEPELIACATDDVERLSISIVVSDQVEQVQWICDGAWENEPRVHPGGS